MQKTNFIEYQSNVLIFRKIYGKMYTGQLLIKHHFPKPNSILKEDSK